MESSYEYIVCGAGSSGCVVASRLSEDSDITVLLLEAGPNDDVDPRIKVPGYAASLQRTNIDWNYKTEPQTNAYQGYKDHVANWPRGKVLGGSSCINSMGYARGHSDDYEALEKMGIEEWGWMNVFPYYLKSENNTIPQYENEMEHYNGGPLTVSLPEDRSQMSQDFLNAGEELGYDVIDVNNGMNVGFGDFPATIDTDGVRCSVSKAFLKPAMDRSNLTVLTGVHVTKIDIDNQSASGVRFLQDGEEKSVAATKDVIVCCGVIGSPQLLMLSGIGPKEHLEQLGIHCKADLPVGQNLQDHIGVQMKATVKPDCRVKTHELKQKIDDRTNNKNMLSSNFMDATAFIQTSVKPPDIEVPPDIQINFLPTFYPYGPDEPDLYELKSSTFSPIMGYENTREERMRKEGVAFVPTLLHPKSKGEIRLRNTDPLLQPLINPHYLEDPNDVKILLEGVRFVKKIAETKAMKQYGVQLLDITMPSNKEDMWSDDNLEDYIRHFATTQFHPIGTCKMGGKDDPTSVVDPHLRVRGIRKLRVVDSSIIPILLSAANTNAPSIMVAEKAVNIIEEDRESDEQETATQNSSVESSPLIKIPACPATLQIPGSSAALKIPGSDPNLTSRMSTSPNVFLRRPRASSARNSPVHGQQQFNAISE